MEHCDRKRPGCRKTHGLFVRTGKSELSVIRSGRWRIGQPVNRCRYNEHSEQPCQAVDRVDPCRPGSMHCDLMHCGQDSSKTIDQINDVSLGAI
jgi:hypothetical protein